MRRTKIVCTIGPKTCRYDKLEKLAARGMNVVRLNMSHGTHEWHREVIKAVRTINEKGQYSIALLIDTKGPEVRSGDLKQEITLQKGSTFVFTIRREAEYEEYCTEVSYDGFINDVEIGDSILVDGGILEFVVKDKTNTDIICECMDKGTLTSRRHLNVRGRSANLPSITEKDWEDIKFAVEEKVDFIALSFIKKAAVIDELRDYFEKHNASIDIIAKIESAAAVPVLDEILEKADGAMVARGDLGAEVPFEEVPLLQDRMIRTCRKLGKPVIVATHLLESMIVHPTPTRAEVSDIAIAVQAKSDAIMLSGETALGNHPNKSVETMHKVATYIEKALMANKKITVAVSTDPKEEMVMSAAIMANNLDAAAILVFTRRGHMAGLLSRCRPNSPIFAFTNMSQVRRKLNLYWGVQPYRISFSKNPEKTIARAIDVLKEKNILKSKNRVIVVSDILVDEEYVQTIQIRELS